MATAVQNMNTCRLDPGQRGAEATAFELALRRKIVGQDEAGDAVADLYQTFRAGLNSPGDSHAGRQPPRRFISDNYLHDLEPSPVLSNLFNPSSNPRSGRLARIYKYLAVPGGLVSCCKYLSSTRCHGRGRGFESRRPRHSFQQHTESPLFKRVAA
jgi:hypothetical protein